MSKGTIKTNLGDGQYTVTLNYDRARVTDAITVLDGRIADLTAKIEEMEEGTQKSMAQLQLTALEKKKAFLEDPNNVIPDEDINAYCADLTTDLTGEVGVIDIPGEGQHFNIQPGYEGNAVYDADRDGQFQHVWGGTPSSVFYNLAMLPGWQKWRPTYRYGTVSNLSGDTCDVTLDAAISTQQSLGVNQAETLTGVTIEYMSCNGAAFENGDEVIVKFEDQDWTKPKVIGFKEEPAACCCWSMIFPTTVDHTLTHISCYDGAQLRNEVRKRFY